MAVVPNWKPAKGSHRREKKRRQGREQRERSKVRYQVWTRDGGRCRCCGRSVLLKSDSLFTLAHMHEIEFRSHQGDPLDTRNVITLCHDCHLRGIHHQMARKADWIEIEVRDDEHGADNVDSGIAFRKAA